MDSLVRDDDYDSLISKRVINLKLSVVENDLLKRQFTKNSAFCKTFILMLIKESPRNITNGERIDPKTALSHYNKKEFHHIFSQAFLKNQGFTTDKRNNICNIYMLSSLPNKDVSDEPPSASIPK